MPMHFCNNGLEYDWMKNCVCVSGPHNKREELLLVLNNNNNTDDNLARMLPSVWWRKKVKKNHWRRCDTMQLSQLIYNIFVSVSLEQIEKYIICIWRKLSSVMCWIIVVSLLWWIIWNKNNKINTVTFQGFRMN